MNWSDKVLPPLPTDPILAKLEIDGRNLVFGNPAAAMAPLVAGAVADAIMFGIVLMQLQHWWEHFRCREKNVIRFLVVSTANLTVAEL